MDGTKGGAETLRMSSRNLWFQRVQVLRTNRKKRLAHGQFLVEGVRSINQLRGNPRWTTEALIYPHGVRLSGWAEDVLREVPAATHIAADEALLAELSDREEGSEILAVVKMPAIDDQFLSPERADGAVVLDRPGNPGNLGSILRSADALGSGGVVLTGHGVDPFEPVVVRAAAGAFFGAEISRMARKDTLVTWLDGLRASLPGFQVVGTSAKGTVYPWECDFTRPSVLLMGNETRGLSAWLKELCDITLRIDMTGAASSLNLACATTAFLYERYRQRAAAIQRDGGATGGMPAGASTGDPAPAGKPPVAPGTPKGSPNK